MNNSKCKLTTEKDLGVVIDQNLISFTAAVAAKTNRLLGIASKCFEHLDVANLPVLYSYILFWNIQMPFVVSRPDILCGGGDSIQFYVIQHSLVWWAYGGLRIGRGFWRW